MMEEEILSQVRYPTGEDMSLIKSYGISVDDDNKQAIGNMPVLGNQMKMK